MYEPHSYHYANGEPSLSGNIRTFPEDFVVHEKFAFDFTGEGEHVLLQIQKRNTNTEWLARQIVKLSGLRKMDISYAGLKDRNALTTQWFSIWLPKGEEPDWHEIENEDISILTITRHNRKLRRGSLNNNIFNLTIRNVSGDYSDLQSRVDNIRLHGVPNYYGEQRFGHHGMNIEKAEAMFEGVRIKDRHKRSLYLSAARSLLFNSLLSERVKQNTWLKAEPGDVMLLDNSRSHFLVEEVTSDILRRIQHKDIHTSGCLWGSGDLWTKHKVNELESRLKCKYPLFTSGLEKAGLKQERRALRLRVDELECFSDSSNLKLSFSLPAGGYATSVLREIIKTH